MLKIKDPLRDTQVKEGSTLAPKLSKPMDEYTLSEVKDYCDKIGDLYEGCPQNRECPFYGICAIWPCDWKFKKEAV